ncbi:hypothetical protein PsB1_0113 [Candidatus Phycosocius spiralis]|uniref:Uncharacterized protein n=1 Tax=Candidatus Phycosocius spiralis TaxID=2815099 RepID=A0ABQ4PSH7_9PROT|nr:hypothetical protein PsB1_0113 [Candidatus Phycosocius spiralis]
MRPESQCSFHPALLKEGSEAPKLIINEICLVGYIISTSGFLVKENRYSTAVLDPVGTANEVGCPKFLSETSFRPGKEELMSTSSWATLGTVPLSAKSINATAKPSHFLT